MKEKNIMFILVSSGIVTIAWIAFTFHHTLVTSTLEPDLQEKLKTISDRFNESAIDAILNRREVTPTYELSGVASDPDAEEEQETITPTPTSIEIEETFEETFDEPFEEVFEDEIASEEGELE